jgi:hypothetical protein
LSLLDLDPDPVVRGTDPDPSMVKQKEFKKNLIPLFFLTSFDFLSLKNYVNVALKSNKQNNFEKKKFLVAILKVSDENSRIRSRIRIR